MMLPLPKSITQARYLPKSSHAGLWYERFFDGYDDDCSLPSGGEKKQAWLKKLVGSTVGDPKVLQQYAIAQRELVHGLGGQALQMTSQWNCITGMGNNHPVENGFAWHPTLATPYLTGAAVKGMVKAWCEIWTDMNDTMLKQWFGDTDQAGGIIFFDAIPTAPIQLTIDIMTPHYGGWYAKGDQQQARDGSNAPADWHDPIPIPFLAVAAAQKFQFAFAFRAGVSIPDVSDRLIDALKYIGAGAKTAAGYGRFERNEKQEQRLYQAEQAERDKIIAAREQQAKRSTMSALECELDQWLETHPEPNTVDRWITTMAAANKRDQLIIATCLKTYYMQRGSWDKPSKKQRDKVKMIKAVFLLEKH